MSNKLERTRQVLELDKKYIGQIQAHNQKFKELYDRRKNTNPLDMTPELRIKMTSDIRQEAEAIVATANKALAEIGNELSIERKNGYLKIVSEWKAVLASLK